LIELLVVILIIAVLASAGTAAALSALERARKVTALSTATAVETAVNNFFTEYGSLPKDGTADLILSTNTDTAFLNALLGQDTTLNTRAIRFLNAKEGKSNKDGMIYGADGKSAAGLYDPWGGPFHVVLDLDYDEEITPTPSAGTSPKLNGRRVAIWSNGADGISGGGKAADDVKSWSK